MLLLLRLVRSTEVTEESISNSIVVLALRQLFLFVIVMSAFISAGISCQVEVHGFNAEVYPNLPERGNLTFGLAPSETYTIQLLDISGRLVCALRLSIPGPMLGGGPGGSSGPMGQPSTQGSGGGGRLRSSYSVSAGASASAVSTPVTTEVGGVVAPGWRERCGLGENMAIRSAAGQHVIKTPSSLSSSSDESDVNVP